MSGTLQGLPLLRCALTVPRWGAWHADAVVASGTALEVGARVSLVLGGATYSGTVRAGGVWREEGRYRIVAGADGWARSVLDRSYQSALGVRRRNVVADAAREVGETIGDSWLDDVRVGPHFARSVGTASDVLDAVAADGWYLDEAGVTQLGARPAVAFALPYVLDAQRLDSGVLVVKAEDITGLVPGAQLEGGTAASVRHELTEGGLRSVVWLARESAADRMMGAFRSLVRWLTRETAYHRLVEYRVASVASGTLDLRPARGASGMPALTAVPMAHGVPGASAEPQVGSTCLVAFVDGDPTRPTVVAYEGPLGSAHRADAIGFEADAIELDADALTVGSSETVPTAPLGRMLRYGDTFGVVIPALGPSKIDLLLDAPTTGVALCSRVRG
jgi:hypothetical protein